MDRSSSSTTSVGLVMAGAGGSGSLWQACSPNYAAHRDRLSLSRSVPKAAPAINSVVPSVTVAVRDEQGRLLLIHKVDNDLWALPGGGHDPGETIIATAIREVREETGILVEIVGLIGTYTDPRHVMAYDDGEVRQQFSLCFLGQPISGTAREDGTETKAVRWIEPRELDALNIHPSMRLRIDHALDTRRTVPYLG